MVFDSQEHKDFALCLLEQSSISGKLLEFAANFKQVVRNGEVKAAPLPEGLKVIRGGKEVTDIGTQTTEEEKQQQEQKEQPENK